MIMPPMIMRITKLRLDKTYYMSCPRIVEMLISDTSKQFAKDICQYSLRDTLSFEDIVERLD